MSARPSRGNGKRSYAHDDGSDSEHSEESAPKPTQTQSRRSNKRQKAVVTAEHSEDEDRIDSGVDEGNADINSDGERGTKRTTVYEAGQIMKVYVENFMCHRKFSFKLGRHLNFITGRNGSGKSAIAAAIQLCLGSSARHTGRGSNLGKYIREGSEDPAILEVTLLNEGPDAYKPDEYGRRIIVRRIIAKTGSSYHLLSEHKKEVSKLRSELDKILKDFNIYVDTPCCILTQEESKRLIHGTAREKYEFFIKATGLKHLHEELTIGEQDVIECEENLTRAKPQVLQLKSDFDLAKAKAKEFAELDGIDEQIRLHTAKLFWDEVRTIEGSINLLKEKLAEKRDRAEEAQRDYDAVAGSDGTTKDARLKDLRGIINTTAAEIQEMAALVDTKAKEAGVLNKRLTASRRELGEHERNRADHLTRSKEVDSELRMMRERAMQDAGKQEKEVLDQIAACDQEVQQVKNSIQDMDSHRKTCLEEVASLNREIKRVGDKALYHSNAINGAQRELQEARRGRDRASKFGPRVSDLLNRINRERHLFQGPVVGPIGSRVSIREGCEKWSMALECALYTMLKSFIVTTVADRNRLFQMMRALDMHKFHSIVLQANGPRFPTDYPAMPLALNLLDALVVEDDLVFNCLLDQANVDHIALVEEERTITSKFVEHVNGADRLTYGLSRILSINAVTVSYKQGNEASENCHFKLTNSLSADESGYIATLEQRLAESKQELEEAQQEQGVLNQRITAANNEIRKVSDAQQKAHQKLRALSKQRQDLDARYLEVQDLGRVDTTELESEAEALRVNLESIAFDIDQASAAVRAHDSDLKVHMTERAHLVKAHRDLELLADRQTKDLNDFISLCNSNEKRVEGLKRNLAVKKAALDEFVANIYDKETAAYEEKLREAQDNTAKLIAHWDGAPLPLAEKETKVYLERQIKRFQAQLDEGKKKANLEGYTAAILAERMETAKAAYDQKKEEYRLIRENRNTMDDHVQKKKEKWASSFNKTVRLIQRNFDKYAQKQGATGTVEISAEDQSMSLIVQMDANDKKTLATDVKNLSGGERSYTTLCLLLALGHVTESPFRVMDEYDVFMDEGRRNDTLRSIQQHSQRADQFGRQIIVITPNTLASVKNGNTDKVRIHQMPDPVKQSAHGLQQQTL